MNRSRFLLHAGLGAACTALVPLEAPASDPVDVAYAGSLVTVMARALGPRFSSQGFEFRGVAKGSVALANEIRDGIRRPDVFISADPAVIEPLMQTPNALVDWYATFATSRMVIGYARASRFANAFEQVGRGRRRLAEVLLEPGLRLGRTDPRLDPKGYRTIIAARLLETFSGVPNFTARLLGEDRNAAQIFPEETLLVRLESGELDAAFLYSTESVARALPAVELPAEANLGDERYASAYANEVYSDGTRRFRGGLIAYAVTIPQNAPHPSGAAAFLKFLLSHAGSDTLAAYGLHVIPPMIAGDRSKIPANVLPARA